MCLKALKVSKFFVFIFVFGCTQQPARTLKVLTFRDRQSSALRQALPQFEAENSVRVQLDDIPGSSVATKMMTDLAAGGTYDVYALDEPFIPQFHDKLLPTPLWPELTTESLSGFEGKALRAAEFEGIRVGLPVNGNVYQYIFRKDMFNNPKEQKDFEKRFNRKLTPPQNFSELLEIAQHFYRPPLMYGFAPFTKMSEGTTVELLWLLAGFGYTPGEKNIPLTTVAKALNFYEQLLATAPKSARAWHHTERMSAYAKGRVAQMMTWNSFFFDLEDEFKSLVVGKTGYTRSPGSTATSLAGSWVASIRKGSPETALASRFIQWWTSSKLTTQLVPKGLSTARSDVLTEPQLNSQFPWLNTTHLNFERAFLRPRHLDYRKTSDQLSQSFTRWIAGQLDTRQASEALHNALIDMNRLAAGRIDQRRAN
jgi:multiple sugar transport system substrate-binding protein